IFDHTSILKTILVHNRGALPGSVLGSFGQRVDAAAHLGQVLDLDSPRPAPQPFDPLRRGNVGGNTRYPLAVGPQGVVATEGTASPSTPVPSIPPRTITIGPGGPKIDKSPGDPRDFHTALRHMFEPRR